MPSEVTAQSVWTEHAEPDGDSALEHLTSRRHLIVQLMRALLSDPDLLLANLKGLRMDRCAEDVFGALCIWQRSGLQGLLNELKEQRPRNTDERPQFNYRAALLRAEGQCDSKKVQRRPRTLVLLPPSADLIQASLISDAILLRLVDPSTCTVEPFAELQGLVGKRGDKDGSSSVEAAAPKQSNERGNEEPAAEDRSW